MESSHDRANVPRCGTVASCVTSGSEHAQIICCWCPSAVRKRFAGSRHFHIHSHVMTLGNATAESQRARQVQGPAFVGCSVRAELLEPALRSVPLAYHLQAKSVSDQLSIMDHDIDSEDPLHRRHNKGGTPVSPCSGAAHEAASALPAAVLEHRAHVHGSYRRCQARRNHADSHVPC